MTKDDMVLEIGPGHRNHDTVSGRGSKNKVVAVEIDRNLLPFYRNTGRL